MVYGDIGTSVLYTLKEVFGSGHVPFTETNVYGVLSIVFWTLTLIVSLKYVTLVLRADNQGEGGLVAMLTLALHAVRHKAPRLTRWMLPVGIFGACLFYGDGVITPAITVLSAVEGLDVASSALRGAVIPLTLMILLALFLLQKRGTAGIGRFFGPVMGLWFVVIAGLGVWHIAVHPAVLTALSPHHAAGFIARQPGISFVLLGAVVLCVTGAEALYADLGHFGVRPIRHAWFAIVMPALTLNYFGQGALLLQNPAAVTNPFFMLAPKGWTLALVVLAAVAAVIASQALISGAFSVTRQIIQLGFLPRLKIVHTSVRDLGQIYLPFVNWVLFAMIVLAVVLFRSSSNLAAAYGIAVTLDMLITTVLAFFVIRYGWGHPLALCIAATGVFLLVDLAFVGSNLLKLLQGGWFPIAIAALVFMLMSTWKRGRELLQARLREESIGLADFLASILAHPPARVEGTAVFLHAEADLVPHALLHNLKHNKVLHRQNLFVTVCYHDLPWIGLEQRVQIESLGSDCWQVRVNFGFKNDLDLPRALQCIQGHGCALDPMSTSYFLSREAIIPALGSAMAPWRQRLFALMHHNASGIAAFLHLPSNAVVELGSKVEL